MEYRNKGLLKQVEESDEWSKYGQGIGEFTFPAGTVLKVARIYIRGSWREYDSMTFTVQSVGRDTLEFKKPDCGSFIFDWNKKRKPRFWAKLADVNKIHVREDA